MPNEVDTWASVFAEGRVRRELRLSPEELSHLLADYPEAEAVRQSAAADDDRSWFMITLPTDSYL